jgi:hypothetical protein
LKTKCARKTDSYSSAVKTGLLTWSMLLRVSYYTFNYAGNTNCLNMPYISVSQHTKNNKGCPNHNGKAAEKLIFFVTIN